MPLTVRAKLHLPEPVGLERARLLAPLVDPAGPGVVVVKAPPGSGKTTLMALAAARSASPTVWYAAGPEDRAGPGFVGRLAQAVSRGLGVEPVEVATARDLVLWWESLSEKPLLVMLDDVHELAGGSAESELADVLRWRPPHVRMVLGTRRPVQANTPRLMVSGDLVELDSDALRFRSWEVEELFRRVYDEPLPPEAAAALTGRTGGWAAGLMLFHLATAGKPVAERERAVAELSGRSRLLRSYLTRNVLDELDPDRRRFLLATCTLGTLTGPLCDALLEREGSAAVLEDLAQRQFFTTLSEDGGSYRYHQVMRTLLEGLLVDELGARAAADLHARAAHLLETEGLLRDALRAYALAEDVASVARVVQSSDANLAAGIQDAAEDLSEDDPWLVLARARRLLRQGAVRDAVAGYRRAEALLEDSDFRSRFADERAATALWLPDAPAGGGPSAPRSVPEVLRRATRRLPGPDQSPADPLAEGLVRLLAGELAAARRALEHYASTSAVQVLVADFVVALADVADGAGSQCLGRLEEIILTAAVEEQPWLARLARGVQSVVLLVTDPEPWRAESCGSLIEECRRHGDDWGATLLAGFLGAAESLRGDPDALGWLDRAAAGAAALDAPVLQTWAETVGAALARRRGASDAEQRGRRVRALTRATGLWLAEPMAGRLATGPGDGARPILAEAPRVWIRCLGTFGLVREGREVVLPPLRPRPLSLLLMLARHFGEAVHREVLLEALWPDAPVDAAHHRLHAAASSVRRCLAEADLGADVVRRGEAYGLELDGAGLDVAVFEASQREASRCEARGDREGALAHSLRALDSYTGDLLSELGPAEWVVTDRERLRMAAATAAYTAGRHSLQLRVVAEALRPAQRAVELDPLRASAWSLLGEVQEALGDRRAAAVTRELGRRVTDELAAPLAPGRA